MSRAAKVVPIRNGRLRRRKAEELERRVRELELELELGRDEGLEADTPLVTLARLLSIGKRELNWENVAQFWAFLYFSIHSEEVDDFGYDPKFAATLRPLLEFLYTLWWRVEVEGIDSVPASGAGLIVSNHSGVLPWDGAMIKLAVLHEHSGRRDCRLLALDMFALLPFLAPLLARFGEVRASQENGQRLLERGELVGVFPEGVKGVGKSFKKRYKLARFGRGGFVRLALKTGAPLIPCAVVGAEEIHPVLAKANWLGRPLGLPYFPITPTFPLLGLLGVVPLPSRWSIEFADPIPTAELGADAADDPLLVNRLTREVRATIQDMIDGRLARRRSVWFG